MECPPALTAISLGGGVQSSTLALMAAQGELGPMPDVAIFADTGWEPPAVYEHLDWLEAQLPFPVHRISKSNIRDDLLAGTNSTGQPFISIPLYSRSLEGKAAVVRRQCTREYKITPIEQELRRILGVGYRKQVPRDTTVEMWIGISFDEAPQRMKDSRLRWLSHTWPLVDLRMTREDCRDWFAERFPERTLPRSACVGCPYHTDAEWREMRETDPVSWTDAVFMDEYLRESARAVRFDGNLFLHNSRRPLSEVDLSQADDTLQPALFGEECEGMCGV